MNELRPDEFFSRRPFVLVDQAPFRILLLVAGSIALFSLSRGLPIELSFAQSFVVVSVILMLVWLACFESGLAWYQCTKPSVKVIVGSVDETLQKLDALIKKSSNTWYIGEDTVRQSGLRQVTYISKFGENPPYSLKLIVRVLHTSTPGAFLISHWFEFEGTPLWRMPLIETLRTTQKRICDSRLLPK
jgi:hypothetical protein